MKSRHLRVAHLVYGTCLLLISAAALGASTLDEGLKAYESGDYQTAIEKWQTLIRQGSPDGLFYLGVMYAGGKGLAQDKAKAFQLYSEAAQKLDTATGHATLRGQIAASVSSTEAGGGGLATSERDFVMHTSGEVLYDLNPANGAPTVVQSLEFPALPAADPQVNALDFDPTTRKLFASVVSGSGSAGQNYLGMIDPDTGAVSLAGGSQTQAGLDAIAFFVGGGAGGPGSPEALVGPCTVTYAAGVTGTWETAANWGGTLPGATDVACIPVSSTVNLSSTQSISALNNSGTLNVGGSLTLASESASNVMSIPVGGTLIANDLLTVTGTLNLSGGTLTGTGNVTVNGTMNWSGGSQQGAGSITNANGGISITGVAQLDLGRTLNNAVGQTVTISGPGRLDMGNGAVFNNPGTVDIQNDGSVGGNLGGVNTFNHSGTLTKSGGAGSSTISGTFVNTGTVNANSGTLALNGTSTNSGPMNVSATLRFNSGTTNTLTASSSVTGAGTVDFAGGTTDVNGTYNITGASAFNSGTVNFNVASTVTSVGALTINNGTVNFSSGNTITPTNAVTQSGGVLTGTDTVNLNSLFTWSGGSQQGAGSITNANGGISITGVAQLDLGRTLNNAVGQTVTISGPGRLDMGNGAVFNNPGTVDIQNDGSVGGNLGGVNTFNHSGTLTKSGGAGSSTISGTFVNTGTVNANSGTLALNGTSTNSGPMNVSATLRFNSGTINTLTASSSVTGAGTVDFAGGTTDVNGTYNITGASTFNSGTANFNAASTVTSVGALTIDNGTVNFSSGNTITPTNAVTQSGGVLTGTDTVNLNSLFTWSGGSQTGAGITNANGGMNITGFAQLDLGRILNNLLGQTVTISGPGRLDMGNGAVFNNPGTVDIQNDGSVGGNLGGVNTFNHSGTLTKSGGAGSSTISGTFVNTGTVNANSGTLALNGTSTNSGPMNVSATLRFNSGTTNTLTASSSVTGAGTVDFAGGTTDVNGTYNITGASMFNSGTANFNAASTVTSVGALTIDNGTVNFSSGNTITPTNAVTQSGGVLTGTDTLNLNSLFTWSGGSQRGAGSITNANGGMNITGFAQLDLGRILNNLLGQTVTISGPGRLDMGNGAVFNNPGTVDIQNDGSVGGNLGGANTFNNSGTLTKSGGVGGSSITATFVNTGTVDANGRTLNFGSTYTQTGAGSRTDLHGGNIGGNLVINGGLLKGVGTVTGSVTNAATVTPGASPGTTTIVGDYTQTAAGTLTLELGGTAPGSFDLLAVTGAVNLSGNLNAISFGGFTPSGADSFAVLTFASRTGNFTTANLIVNGFAMARTFGPTSMTLAAAVNTCTFTYAAGVTGTWETAANWGGTLPGAGDVACIPANSTVAVNTTQSIGALNNLGTLNIPGGSLTFTAESASNVLSINGGALIADGDMTSTGTLTLTGNGTLTGVGTLTVTTGTFTLGNGANTMSGTGATNIAAGAVLAMNLSGGISVLSFRTINNAGTTTWLSAGSLLAGNTAVFNNQNGGIFDIQSDGVFGGGLFADPLATFNNQAGGTLRKTAGGTFTFSTVVVNNSGSVLASFNTTGFNGTLAQSAGLTRLNGGAISSTATLNFTGGILDGVGTITGNVISTGGTVVPGLSPGILTIAGNYTQGALGSLNIELTGLNPATQFDRVLVSGSATLGGTLNVLTPGFTPVVGNSFQIMTFASHSGDFATKTGVNFPGFTLEGVFGVPDTSLTLSAEALAGVPATISGSGLGGGAQSTIVNTAFPFPLQVTVDDGEGSGGGSGGALILPGAGGFEALGVPGLVVTFSVPGSGASGTFPGGLTSVQALTDANGVAVSPTLTANTIAGGPYNATATVAGVGAPAIFPLTNLPGAPASLAGSGGGGGAQSTVVNTAFGFPLQITLADAFGNGVPGVQVTFSVPAAGASGTFPGGLTSVQVATNGAGVAVSPTLTANAIAGGPYNATATVAGVAAPALFALTNLPGAATSISGSGGGGGAQSTFINTAFGFPLQVTVRDGFGNGVPGLLVTFSVPANGASGTFPGGLTSVQAATNASGVAVSPTLTANAIVGGPYNATATVAGVAGQALFPLTNLLGPGSTMSGSGGGGGAQSTIVNTAFAFPLQVTVRDAGAVGVQGVPVTFAVPVGGASGTFPGGLTSVQAVTNAAGVAVSPTLTANTIAGGPYNATATVAGIAGPALFALTNLPGAATSISGSGGGAGAQSTVVNTAFAFPLQVTARDAFANGVPGILVTFSVPAAGASGTFPGALTSVQVATNASGVAATPVLTANGTAGSYNGTATAPGIVAPALFVLTNLAGPPATITPTGGGAGSQRAYVNTAFGNSPQVVVRDAGGNGAPGVLVTFGAPGSGPSGSFAGGVNTATTNAGGVATSPVFTANGTAGGPYNVTATVAGLGPASFSMTNVDFSVAPTNGPQSVAAGEAANFTLNFTVMGGKTLSPVALECQNLPPFTTYTFNPGSFPAESDGSSFGLVFKTTPRPDTPHGAGGNGSGVPVGGLPAALVALLATVALGVISFTAGTKTLVRRRAGAVAMLAAVCVLAGYAAGCAGEGTGFPVQGSGQGTPAGNYTVTVMAKSGAVQRSTTLTLTVR